MFVKPKQISVRPPLLTIEKQKNEPYWLEEAQLLDMTEFIMNDAWIFSLKELKVRWPEFPSKYLLAIRRLVDKSHLKFLDSKARQRLNIPRIIRLIETAARVKNLMMGTVSKSGNPSIEEDAQQRKAISMFLQLEDLNKILEYCVIQKSKLYASYNLIHLTSGLTSIDKIEKQRKNSPIEFRTPLTDSWSSVASVAKNFVADNFHEKTDVSYLEAKFFISVGEYFEREANKKKSPNRHSDIPSFLFLNWCGSYTQNNDHTQRPPLCFFSWGAIAQYCALRLGLKGDDKAATVDNIRKYGNRLGLKPVKRPFINWVILRNGKFYFRK